MLFGILPLHHLRQCGAIWAPVVYVDNSNSSEVVMRLLGLRFVLLLVFVGTCFSTRAQAEDHTKGKSLYATCLACHGDKGQGNALLKAPSIAGLPEYYLVNQITKFKNGVRGKANDPEGLMMAPMAKMLVKDADVAAVYAYVASMPAVQGADTLKGDAVAGKIKYMVCMACHGDKGQGNELLKSPPLSNADDWYMLKQLHKFKDGIRGADAKDIEGMQMAPMAKMLAKEQDMKDVIAYIRSLGKSK